MRPRRVWFDFEDSDTPTPAVAVLGLPWDGSTSFRAGAAEAPGRLRELSRTSDAVTRRGRVVEGVTVRDFGDVSAGGRATARAYFESARARLDALPRDSFVLVLGGDNAVSIPSIEAFVARHGTHTGIVWFDAHPDLFEIYDGSPDSHACALRTAQTRSGLPAQQTVLLATRSFSLEESAYIHSHGLEVVTAAEWAAMGSPAVVERVAGRLGELDAVYLAMDIDGFDASCAPGTGYPMPVGPPAEAVFQLLEGLFERLPIRAMDLTEIAPPLDRNDITAFLGVQVVLETLGCLALKPPRAAGYR